MKMLQLTAYLIGRLNVNSIGSEAVNIGMNDATDGGVSHETVTGL